MSRIAVLYLARKGNPARWTRAFLDSLAAHPAGAPYELVMILKGYAPGETDPVLQRRWQTIAAPVLEWRVYDELFPIAVFFRAAEAFARHDRLVFLVSRSRVLAPNWLAHYLGVFDSTPGCGLVGATGSHAERPGAPFPNRNVRSTAFMIARDLFLGLERGPQATRNDGIAFEAGPDSMTRQIERRGLVARVVDRTGRAWHPDDWPISQTFRSGEQSRLLVADNRTDHYATSNLRKRRVLAQLAFGDRARVAPSSIVSRLRAHLAAV